MRHHDREPRPIRAGDFHVLEPLGELEFLILIDDDRRAWSRAGERWLWPWSWAPGA